MAFSKAKSWVDWWIGPTGKRNFDNPGQSSFDIPSVADQLIDCATMSFTINQRVYRDFQRSVQNLGLVSTSFFLSARIYTNHIAYLKANLIMGKLIGDAV